ncbi:MAG: hypothetical protein AAGD09_08040 [Cyanobacteria bacterium P01_F01_bin.56]
MKIGLLGHENRMFFTSVTIHCRQKTWAVSQEFILIRRIGDVLALWQFVIGLAQIHRD